MTTDDRDRLQWRNWVVQWHLDQDVPLDCGCDDDTPESGYCATSVEYADRHFTARPDPTLDGPPDPWDHDIWKAAWGRNVTLVVSDLDYRLPKAPEGMMWLLTRLLVRGRKAIEVVLYQLGEDKLTARLSARVGPDPTVVAVRARRMLDDLST